ncbi:helix-turn-helix transcriptional regulator [Gemmobacter sp. LW-1]|jgi:transcriptional regulator with XRE-family HTH domain|uniref:helix-turn-helix transcriptional regulator n=1 Tax=Gemmobacter sp. LW-1 TaxID=1529005 RepID=UPI000AAFF025|nr:helix-turn-helix transcriptional regulator [Gemmobacter sp. LW-1]
MDHPMRKDQTISPPAQEALGILAAMIRAARMQRGMTAAELGARVGVSRGVIQRLEAGEPGTAIGTAFEAAVILGIPLFDVPADQLGTFLGQRRALNALLPKRAFQASQSKPDNDF